MSDAAAGAALVVEQVLLYDASLLTIGRKRVAAAEFLINESLYPNINGRHRGTAIAKEADAVCYLFADAVQLEEAGKESVVGQRRQSTEVECAAGSLCGSVLDVTGAVAQTTAHQLRPREAAELLRGGEEENFIVFGIERFAAAPGKAFYGGADGRNALALGDKKGDEHFPWVLMQDSDALPEIERFVQIADLSRQAAPQRGIVPAQIKVVGPILPI